MRRSSLFFALTIVLSTLSLAMADDDHGRRGRRVRAYLSGYNEVHFNGGMPTATPPTAATLRGAVSTKASGHFVASIDKKGEIITYELSYTGLEGPVTQAHIHFGQKHTVGGIVVWLCQTAGTPAPTAVADVTITPICPADGTVTGTIKSAQVLEQPAQGIATGEFAELVRAIRAGAVYVNVHTSLFMPGEIRGQVDGH